MQAGRRVNDEQMAFWNGAGGRAWVELEAVLDQILGPFTDVLVHSASIRPAGRVLDVGCGAGSTTLAVARLLGDDGDCIGIDISEALTATARARAEREGVPASFTCADAATHAFEPESVDVLISRFGVMFFDDPVRAFANLRRAARRHAQLRFVAWRSPAENPFMTAAERAARPLLAGIPDRQPDAPGQFAFADSRRVMSILEKSGWAGIDIRPIDIECMFPAKELIRYFTKAGPVGRVLHDADSRTRIEIIETVRAAFDPYVFGADVRFTSACWLVSARAEGTPLTL